MWRTGTLGAVVGGALLLLTSGCLVEAEPQRCAVPGACVPWDRDDEDEGSDDGSGDGPGEGETGSDDDGPSGDGPGDDGPADGAGLPCDVRDALLANCGTCHGETPSFGAPMPLTSYDDLRVPATTDPSRPVYEVVAERMTAEVGMMPLDGQITAQDEATILDWISQGAPEHMGSCDAPPDAEPEDDVGPEHLPCDASVQLTAHASGGDQPYHVPSQGADDLYQCFAFRSPFAAGTQATAWAPIIDDERVVHHWILYRASGGNYSEGAAFPCDVSLQLSADFVAGWAPGGENVVMPDDVGLDLGSPSDWFVLQVHYNNTAGHVDAMDRSGVAFCTTPAPRTHTAGVLTLGTSSLNIPPGAQDHEETGTCGFFHTWSWPGPLHLLAGSPHMHEYGRAFRTTLERLGGGTEVVTDVPVFDFESQGMVAIEPEIVVNPGDTLRSTCVFDNPTDQTVHFGEGTSDEMCFNFVLAYPIDQLANRNCGIIL